jgi:hypothetical protein
VAAVTRQASCSLPVPTPMGAAEGGLSFCKGLEEASHIVIILQGYVLHNNACLAVPAERAWGRMSGNNQDSMTGSPVVGCRPLLVSWRATWFEASNFNF